MSTFLPISKKQNISKTSINNKKRNRSTIKKFQEPKLNKKISIQDEK